VTDDGCGMDELPELSAQQGFGLTNMRERAQAIGGEWQVTSTPGAGTRIDVRVPIVVREAAPVRVTVPVSVRA
jgi:signal transduction histidine kinase